jgi:hypothetical protein
VPALDRGRGARGSETTVTTRRLGVRSRETSTRALWLSFGALPGLRCSGRGGKRSQSARALWGGMLGAVPQRPSGVWQGLDVRRGSRWLLPRWSPDISGCHRPATV